MSENRRCIACGGPLEAWLSMPIDAKKNELTSYTSVVRCTGCGLGVLEPMPEADAIAGLYALDSYYTHGESHIAAVRPSLADRLLIRIAWQFDYARPFDPEAIAALLPSSASVCDLGCGGGTYLRRFRQLGLNVTGVDPDPSAVASGAGVPIELGTAEQIPAAVAGRQFDLVIMTHALEHCRNPVFALKNSFALTKPGGYCYIEVPNCDSEHFRTFTVTSEMFDAPRHIYFFTPHALGTLMQSIGFLPVETMYMGYLRNFSPDWRQWESLIADRIVAAVPSMRPRRHSFAASVALFAQSFWRRPERKYDSIGFLMRRASAA